MTFEKKPTLKFLSNQEHVNYLFQYTSKSQTLVNWYTLKILSTQLRIAQNFNLIINQAKSQMFSWNHSTLLSLEIYSRSLKMVWTGKGQWVVYNMCTIIQSLTFNTFELDSAPKIEILYKYQKFYNKKWPVSQMAQHWSDHCWMWVKKLDVVPEYPLI